MSAAGSFRRERESGVLELLLVSPLGEGLFVKERHDGNRLTLVVATKADADCTLHWGLSRRPGGAWQRPPDALWPAASVVVPLAI